MHMSPFFSTSHWIPVILFLYFSLTSDHFVCQSVSAFLLFFFLSVTCFMSAFFSVCAKSVSFLYQSLSTCQSFFATNLTLFCNPFFLSFGHSFFLPVCALLSVVFSVSRFLSKFPPYCQSFSLPVCVFLTVLFLSSATLSVPFSVSLFNPVTPFLSVSALLSVLFSVFLCLYGILFLCCSEPSCNSFHYAGLSLPPVIPLYFSSCLTA